jgi:hypothetical protein
MGCTTSKNSTMTRNQARAASFRAASLRVSKAFEHEAEDLMLIEKERQERLKIDKQLEKEFNDRLYAEKERLRKLSVVKIETRLSCESLMDSLNQKVIFKICLHFEFINYFQRHFLNFCNAVNKN